MNFLKLVIFLSFFQILSCTNALVKKDHRQIIAKNEVVKKLPAGAHSFDISAFDEDTIPSIDMVSLQLIRYKIKYRFVDSSGKLMYQTAHILFAPDGDAVMKSEIVDNDSKSIH